MEADFKGRARVLGEPHKPLLLDSNLLLLLVVGAFDPRLLHSFKRLSDFSAKDFELLRAFCSQYKLLTTPHVLTEVSNLANSLPSSIKSAFFAYFASVIATLVEIRSTSQELSSDPAFALFGLTDTALAKLSSSALLVTHDGRLRGYLRRQNLAAIGLEEIQAYRVGRA